MAAGAKCSVPLVTGRAVSAILIDVLEDTALPLTCFPPFPGEHAPTEAEAFVDSCTQRAWESGRVLGRGGTTASAALRTLCALHRLPSALPALSHRALLMAECAITLLPTL